MTSLPWHGALPVLGAASASPPFNFPGLAFSPKALPLSHSRCNGRIDVCVCSVGGIRKVYFKDGGDDEEEEEKEEEEADDDWKSQLLTGISPFPERRRPLVYLNAGKAKVEEQEWAVRARTLGFQKLQERNFSSRDFDRLLPSNQTKKKRFRGSKASHGRKKRVQEYDSLPSEESSMAALGLGYGDQKTAYRSDVRFDSKRDQWREETALHRALIKAEDPHELLKLVSSHNPKVLTAMNVATALHRIAKHMETLSSSESQRLIIARHEETCKLVRLAVEMLPESSAQGLSNIAWALSKLGGRFLYEAEMDAVAEAVMQKVDQFNAQNVANTAGAFASMQHTSPVAFDRLASRASRLTQFFKPQELAQLMWSFASLNHPLDPLLDVLDTLSHPQTLHIGHGYDPREDGAGGFLNNISLEHLANIAWSYAVLGEFRRPFCSFLLSSISTGALEIEGGMHSGSMQLGQQRRLLGQLHQVFTCLKLEYSAFPYPINETLLELTQRVWEEEKNAHTTTSLLQKNLQYFLASTGRDWVYEYSGADYSLDAALVEEKLAIEVDGPSHFFRNLDLPLGPTVMKRRLLKASGWNLVSLSYQQWESVEGEAQQRSFLQKLLEGYL